MTGPGAGMIDDLMEQASAALLEADYFRTEKLCKKALLQSRRANDFERMSRVILPLQEARRQRRHEACDSGLRFILTTMPASGRDLAPGIYLVQPPLVGMNGRTIRELADAAGIPIVVVCREPMTRAGQWPIVAVTAGGVPAVRSYRIRIAPPEGVEPRDTGMTKDIVTETPDAAWFLAASEALGDDAIAKIDPALPPAWRVDDLLEALDAMPDHEKLHQALAAACRDAMAVPPPVQPRRRGADNPFSF